MPAKMDGKDGIPVFPIPELSMQSTFPVYRASSTIWNYICFVRLSRLVVQLSARVQSVPKG